MQARDRRAAVEGWGEGCLFFWMVYNFFLFSGWIFFLFLFFVLGGLSIGTGSSHGLQISERQLHRLKPEVAMQHWGPDSDNPHYDEANAKRIDIFSEARAAIPEEVAS